MTTRELYTKFYPIQDKGLRKKIIGLTSERILNKNEIVIKQGETDKSIFFLKTGVVTAYEINPNGKVLCLGIYHEPGDILAGGLGPENPYSPVNVATKTHCEVFCIPMKEISKLLEEYPETMLAFYNQILLREYERQWQVKNMLYIESAEERYRWFLRNYPGVIDRISHEIIASFLRMSPVTLSRVRKNVGL